MRAPPIQELLTPNPLDLILLLTVLKFAGSAWEPGSASLRRHLLQQGSLQDLQGTALPPALGATPPRCGGQSAPVDSRASNIPLDQASCPASLARTGAGADVTQWFLESHQHQPCCASQEGGSREGTCLLRGSTSNPCCHLWSSCALERVISSPFGELKLFYRHPATWTVF